MSGRWRRRAWARAVTAVAAATLGCASALGADELELEPRLGLRESTLVQRVATPLGDRWDGLAQGTLRYGAEALWEHGDAEVALETRGLLLGTWLRPRSPVGELRLRPGRWRHLTNDRVVATSELDRARLSWWWGDWALELGRQAIGLGSSRFLSVVDVVAPFGFAAVDTTYRPGVDALRWRYTDATWELETIAAAADPVTAGALLVRWAYHGEVDLELLGGRIRRRNWLGIDWSWDLGRLLWWGEAAAFQRREPWRGGPRTAAIAAVSGLDLLDPWGGTWTLGGYVHQLGSDDPATWSQLATESPTREGWLLLPGRSYLFLGLQGSAAGLVTLGGTVLGATDGGGLLLLSTAVDNGDATSLELLLWAPFGPEEAGLGTFGPGGGFLWRWTY